MRFIYKIPLRFRSLLRKGRVEQELSDELRFHLEKLIEENIAKGMTAEEAHYAARRELGGEDQIEEECRDMRRVNYIESFFHDLRYGLRMLGKNPGFTAVAVLTLALGIGANSAVFSVLNAVLLRPLPYSYPDRLVSLQMQNPRDITSRAPFSYPNFFDFRAQNDVFEHIIAYRDTQFTLSDSGESTHLDAEIVTWDLFPLLGIQPLLGRGFLPSEEGAGSRVTVLSHELWQRQFGGNPGIIGRSITLDSQAYIVVGIAPAGFVFPPNNPAIQLWTTIAPDAQAQPGYTPPTEQRGAFLLPVIARLQRGVTIDKARAQLDVIAAALAKQYPDPNANFEAAYLQPELEQLVGDTRRPLMILLGAVGLVVLIACANLANLLLARFAARQHEMAVRATLGASRGRVVGQLLTEALLLAVFGSAAGVLLAQIALWTMLPLGGAGIPRLAQASIDGSVLIFSMLLSLLTTILFGIVPAVRVSRPDLTGPLKKGARSSTTSHDRLRGILVVGQITLGLVLASGAGLMMTSFLRLERRNFGMRTDHLLTFRFALPESLYNESQQVEFHDRLLERLRGLPGVESAAGVWPLPLTGDDATIAFDIEERPTPPSDRSSCDMMFATPDYFGTVGIPLLRGRVFTQRDDGKAKPVLVVNQAFADEYFPGENVIGKRIEPGATASGHRTTLREIVGVVGNSKRSALSPQAIPIYYFPYKQLPWQPPPVVLRTAVPPRALESAVRNLVRTLDPQVPVYQVRSMEDLISLQIMGPRFHMLLLGSFAGIALLLMIGGLYGVMAYSVARRTREIGLRIALGATQWAVLSMVLKRALAHVLTGLLLGLLGASVAGQFLRGMLYDVTPLNPAVLGSACCLLGLTGIVAAYVPARRATKVDSMAALRYE